MRHDTSDTKKLKGSPRTTLNAFAVTDAVDPTSDCKLHTQIHARTHDSYPNA